MIMKALRLYYCAAARNFGDQMSPLVVREMSGCEIVSAKHTVQADLMAMGSIFYDGGNVCQRRTSPFSFAGALQRLKLVKQAIRPPCYVWGSGFLTDGIAVGSVPLLKLDIRAVRGKYSVALLQKAGYSVDEDLVRLGDPGLLYPSLFGVASEKKEYDLGVVPHMSDTPSGDFLTARFSAVGARVRLIDVAGPVDRVVREIASCGAILSSSLHGLVLADALGVPNRQMLLSLYSIPGDQFLLKFKDYYSAFGEELPVPLMLREIAGAPSGVLKAISDRPARSRDQVLEVCSGLRESFPKELCA